MPFSDQDASQAHDMMWGNGEMSAAERHFLVSDALSYPQQVSRRSIQLLWLKHVREGRAMGSPHGGGGCGGPLGGPEGAGGRRPDRVLCPAEHLPPLDQATAFQRIECSGRLVSSSRWHREARAG